MSSAGIWRTARKSWQCTCGCGCSRVIPAGDDYAICDGRNYCDQCGRDHMSTRCTDVLAKTAARPSMATVHAMPIPPCTDAADDEEETAALVECELCGRKVDEDEMYECAGGLPAWPILECPDCHAECGPCRDENAREWAAEHRWAL